ncbi:hypothetical protein PT974_11455 [Cladobotryum mycophilum]|uniref:Uncharacterized protein n=1 Tax=Cladobotryum mycophilum TaxID=491253 RepID=A0ABR0S5A0_9HYPO
MSICVAQACQPHQALSIDAVMVIEENTVYKASPTLHFPFKFQGLHIHSTWAVTVARQGCSGHLSMLPFLRTSAVTVVLIDQQQKGSVAQLGFPGRAELIKVMCWLDL